MKCHRCGMQSQDLPSRPVFVQIESVIYVLCRIHLGIYQGTILNEVLREEEYKRKNRGNCVAVVNIRHYNL